MSYGCAGRLSEESTLRREKRKYKFSHKALIFVLSNVRDFTGAGVKTIKFKRLHFCFYYFCFAFCFIREIIVHIGIMK